MSQDAPRRWRISRRGLLIGAGALGGGLAIGLVAGVPAVRLRMADQMSDAFTPAGISSDPLIWMELTAAGRLLLSMPKVEMGQGVHTALAQVAADELEVPWGQVEVVQAGSLSAITDPYGTSASNTVSSLFLPLRQAAATMREMLRQEAAARLGAPPAELSAAEGAFVVSASPERRVGYGELVAGRGGWAVPKDPPALKDAKDFTLIGRPMPRVDLPDKIRGAAVYGYDARAEGMRYGAVARPPTIGATLRRAAEGAAMQQPGVLRAVIREGFAGVVAESRAAALAGVQALELEWEERAPIQSAQIEAMVQAGPGGSPVQSAGSTLGRLIGPGVIRAEYRTPLAAHAPLEPQAALVDVRPDRVVALVSTQSPVQVAQAIAAAIGRDAGTVSVTPTFLGGGFGRKLVGDAAIEAAILSAAAGAPVHVGWTRSEEFRNGYVRPPTHSVLRARLDASGGIVAIDHQQASGDVLFPFFPKSFQLLVGSDFGAWRGARISYAVPNISVSARRQALPIPTGSWRGLGLLPNTFAVESFMDELAHAAGADPLEFRLRHLGDDELGRRMAAALRSAAGRAGWGEARPAGRALGLACCYDSGTVVAEVAEVSAGDAGAVRVHRVWAAVDPGLPVNPDGVAAQAEGGITMGLSSALRERLTIVDGAVEAGNFDRYPLLAMAEAPEIDVAVLRSGDTPFGVGEPPMGPIAAAVANAVFALTGRRLRELPLSLA